MNQYLCLSEISDKLTGGTANALMLPYKPFDQVEGKGVYLDTVVFSSGASPLDRYILAMDFFYAGNFDYSKIPGQQSPANIRDAVTKEAVSHGGVQESVLIVPNSITELIGLVRTEGQLIDNRLIVSPLEIVAGCTDLNQRQEMFPKNLSHKDLPQQVQEQFAGAYLMSSTKFVGMVGSRYVVMANYDKKDEKKKYLIGLPEKEVFSNEIFKQRPVIPLARVAVRHCPSLNRQGLDR